MQLTSRRATFLLARGALLLALLLAVQLTTDGGRAHACSCAQPPPPLEALDEAAAVFTGTVASFETYSFEVDFGSDRPESFWSVEIDVDRAWKGPVASTTFVYVWHGPACGYGNFEVGADFLVYADGRDFPGVDDDTLFVSFCSRTVPLERAEDDLLALGEGQAPAPGIAGANPASSAEEQGSGSGAPEATTTSEDAQRGPDLPETGHGTASNAGAAATPSGASSPPTWAIPLLASLAATVILVRLAVRPRRRA